MHNKFKRHQRVILLANPDKEYIEYEPGSDKEPEIKKGAAGIINIILPNGKYHVKIVDKKGNSIAYVLLNEEEIGLADK